MITTYPNCAHLLNSHVCHLLRRGIRPVYANCGPWPVYSNFRPTCLRAPRPRTATRPVYAVRLDLYRPIYANFGPDLFTLTRLDLRRDLELRLLACFCELRAGLFTRSGCPAAPGLFTRPVAYRLSSPLISTSHYAPGHYDAGSRSANIRRHHWFPVPVAIDMSDVITTMTSLPVPP